ncbi:MAG: DUF5388 domain-containing protein [Enterococcus faecalis]
MANSLIQSNRNKKNITPKVIAKAEDFTPEKKSNVPATNVSFDTNLKISNHSRNKLQSIANLGYADSQKSALDLALQAFIDNLSSAEQKAFALQNETLEARDARLKSNK